MASNVFMNRNDNRSKIRQYQSYFDKVLYSHKPFAGDSFNISTFQNREHFILYRIC